MLIPPIESTVRHFDAVAIGDLDLLIGAVGYESRARHIPLMWAPSSKRCIATAFDFHQECAFGENYDTLRAAGFEVDIHKDSAVRDWTGAAVASLRPEPSRSARIGVDVSSMNRSRLAEVLLGIVSVAVNRRVEVVFGYAPAKYQRYKSDSAEIRVKEPVAAEFAGWSGNLDLPLSCVIGLGYEPHRAIGILEFVEPRWACAYEPRGVDTKYDRDVMKVNGPLRAAVPAPLITEYSVRDAWGTYKRLSSLVYGLRSSTRPILVPMGPKIFGLLCMIVALESENEVSVWRVSGGESEPPVDRQASGSIASLGLTLGPVNDSDNAGH